MVLTGWIIGRAVLEFPFHLGSAMLLPLIGFSFNVLHCLSRSGWKMTLLLLGLTLGISLVVECLGVATGLIFGPYHYSNRLGPLFLGLVPYTIPLTWFMMLYPSLILADTLTSKENKWLQTVLIGACALVAWDLVLDPLMTYRSHWIWEADGAYYGVPLQNFLGWWLTAFAILGTFCLFRLRKGSKQERDANFDWLAIAFYAITGAGHVADAWIAGLAGAALIGLIAMGFWVAVSGYWTLRDRQKNLVKLSG